MRSSFFFFFSHVASSSAFRLYNTFQRKQNRQPLLFAWEARCLEAPEDAYLPGPFIVLLAALRNKKLKEESNLAGTSMWEVRARVNGSIGKQT